MSGRVTGAYDHRCRALRHGGYEIAWTVDYKSPTSRLRDPRRFTRTTDETGARAFCRKWGLALPKELAERNED